MSKTYDNCIDIVKRHYTIWYKLSLSLSDDEFVMAKVEVLRDLLESLGVDIYEIDEFEREIEKTKENE